MTERTWIAQRVEVGDALLRFYAPRSWALSNVTVMLAFSAAWTEVARRQFVPMWTLVIVLLLGIFVVFASLDQYRRSSRGILHFQIDRTGVSFGGLAFRPEISIPYSALSRVLVGDRYLDLVAPVLFEFRPSAVEKHNLRLFQLNDTRLPTVPYSYRGITRERLELALSQLLGDSVPVVRFGAVDQPTQLELQVDGTRTDNSGCHVSCSR